MALHTGVGGLEVVDKATSCDSSVATAAAQMAPRCADADGDLAVQGDVDAAAVAAGASHVPAPPAIEMSELHEDPQILLLENFLSPEETAHLLQLAEGRWKQSTVTVGRASQLLSAAPADGSAEPAVDANSPVEVADEDRTSDSVQLDFGESLVVERLLVRVAAVTDYPLCHAEKPILLRYGPGQYFRRHHDGALRPMTVFAYLTDVENGGETHFPELQLRVKPVAGTAIMWYNTLDDGTADLRMEHEALPLTSGLKYGINLFVNRCPQRDASYIKIRDGA